MPDSGKVYEVMQMMQDQTAVQNDMSEAASMVMNMFRDKYVSRLQDAVQSHKTNVRNNPPAEIQLMHALKPFMPEQSQAQMDRIIDMTMMMNTMKNIRDEMSVGGVPYAQGSMPPKGASYAQSPMPPGNIPYAQSQMPPGGMQYTQSPPLPDGSIHPDGIYDMDPACMSGKRGGQIWRSASNNMTGVLMMMTLMGMM